MPFELLLGAAVGAGLASSPVRKAVRKGVVYSLAGALIAYDKVAGAAGNLKAAASNLKSKAASDASSKAAPEQPVASEPASSPAAQTASTH
jgi:hypothetical protein